MAKSKKRASSISSIAAFVYCFIIVFQIPLFRVPCGNRVCETPVEVISFPLVGSELIPCSVVRTLLYPGAIGKSIMSGAGIPSYNKFLNNYSFDTVKNTSFGTDIQHLEVLTGSSLCVLGAFLSLFKPGRISFIGTLLIFWGLIREILLMESYLRRISDKRHTVRIYPTLFLTAVSAILSIRSDVRTIIRGFRAKRDSKSL